MLKGKYSSRTRFWAARAKWGAVRVLLNRISAWQPIAQPRQGYSIVIGCPAPLISILGANLRLLSRQDLSRCDKVVCAIDAPRAELPEDVERWAAREFPNLPLEFVYYTRSQWRLFNALGYPGGFSWFSWYLGLSRVQTRHALLHDFDALPIEPTLLDRRYQAALDSNAEWVGQRFYQGNGIERSDGLATTFEMVLDLAGVRGRFRPVDLFNVIAEYKGRAVEFDTTLWAQTQWGRSVAVDIPESELVHPSQVVHQFTELSHTRNYEPPARNRLVFIPYLMHLAGKPGVLEAAQAELHAGPMFTLAGYEVSLRRTDPDHVSWLAKQASIVETALYGEVRPEVQQYFEVARTVCGGIAETRAPQSPQVVTAA